MKLPRYSNHNPGIIVKRAIGVILASNLLPLLCGLTTGNSNPGETFWSVFLLLWLFQLVLLLLVGLLTFIAWCFGAFE